MTLKRVDRYEYWSQPPLAPSPRLAYWQARIAAGWRPNKRIRGLGYDGAAEFYGVYMWEYLEVLWPILHELRP